MCSMVIMRDREFRDNTPIIHYLLDSDNWLKMSRTRISFNKAWMKFASIGTFCTLFNYILVRRRPWISDIRYGQNCRLSLFFINIMKESISLNFGVWFRIFLHLVYSWWDMWDLSNICNYEKSYKNIEYSVFFFVIFFYIL